MTRDRKIIIVCNYTWNSTRTYPYGHTFTRTYNYTCKYAFNFNANSTYNSRKNNTNNWDPSESWWLAPICLVAGRLIVKFIQNNS